MSKVATGIDVGTSTAKMLRGQVKGTTFLVTDFFIAPNPTGSLEGGWNALAGGFKPGTARVGVTGRDVNMRYTRVPRLADWQLRKLMRFEAEEVSGHSDARVASDFNVLPEIPEIEGEDVVVLCMARESLLAEQDAGLSSIGGKLDAFTPNAIALYNAFLHYGVVLDDTVLVANIGRANIDVVLMRGTDLIFARNLAGGSELFDQAIAERFGVSLERAESYKRDEGTLRMNGPFQDANQEKAARAMTAPAGQILSLLQSAVLFAKSQVKLQSLRLDRVFLCGGGAALEGLPEYLAKAMGVPVEIFDPFVVVDDSKLDAAASAALEEHRLEAVLALGLATTGSDPDAYSIEILPEKVKRRREFLGGTAFLIAAAVLAALFLGVFGWKKKSELASLDAEARRLGSELRRATSRDGRARSLMAENQELAEVASELMAVGGAGEELVRSLASIETRLPVDFWLEGMTLGMGTEEGLGVVRGEELPILRVRGRAREGTDSPEVQWEEFVAALHRDLPEARIQDRMGRSDFTLDLVSLLPPAEEPAASEDE
ncbi:MAG TPA: hypothetical protein ENJ09_06010 [Planctomycetes bacterium]|nr:hypothetical protein [Planctomycetota bacterium]